MGRIKTAVIGAGFMGKVHAEVIRRVGNVEIVAVAGVDDKEAQGFGRRSASRAPPATTGPCWRIPDRGRSRVHAERPASPDFQGSHEGRQARPVREAAGDDGRGSARPGDAGAEKQAVNCVNHNLRYYPVVQQIRQMIGTANWARS